MMKTFDEQLHTLVTAALQEDVGNGDHSTLCCIPADKKGKAVLKIKQDGILAGVEVAQKFLHCANLQPSSAYTKKMAKKCMQAK